METTFERLKRLYNEGRLNAEQLHRYVDKGIITEEQYLEIIALTEEGELVD